MPDNPSKIERFREIYETASIPGAYAVLTPEEAEELGAFEEEAVSEEEALAASLDNLDGEEEDDAPEGAAEAAEPSK